MTDWGEQMVNVCEQIYTVFKNDTELINLLGGIRTVEKRKWKRVYNSQIAKDPKEFPRLTMFEVLNSDFDGADDLPIFGEYDNRLDLWVLSDSEIFPIVKRIKQILRSTFENVDIKFTSTDYENDTKIWHKPIDVKIILEEVE